MAGLLHRSHLCIHALVFLVLGIASASNNCENERYFTAISDCKSRGMLGVYSSQPAASRFSAGLHGNPGAPMVNGTGQAECDSLTSEARCLHTEGCWPNVNVKSQMVDFGTVDQRNGCKVTAAALDRATGVSCPPSACDSGVAVGPTLVVTCTGLAAVFALAQLLFCA